MIICRDYNQEKLLDRVWYESSNILYSECDDNVDALKTLRVTFKNGATYEYSEVDVNDYVMFIAGGTDGSNGKALNKHIKPKYDCRRIGDMDLSLLEEEKERLLKEQANPCNSLWNSMKLIFSVQIPDRMKEIEKENGSDRTKEDIQEILGLITASMNSISAEVGFPLIKIGESCCPI